ncbi:PP2C like protein phosphatase, partial [Cryptosporidium canis]
SYSPGQQQTEEHSGYVIWPKQLGDRRLEEELAVEQMDWIVDWGASCSQGGCRENQDGWFMTTPGQRKPDNKDDQKRRLLHSGKSGRPKTSGRFGVSKGVWNFDPVDAGLTEMGTFDTTSFNDPTKDIMTLEEAVDEAFPLVFPLFNLPPSPPKRNGPGWMSHKTGGKVKEPRNASFFGVLDGHGHYGRCASQMGAYCISKILNREIPSIDCDLPIDEYIENVIDVMNRGFSHAHDSIIQANISGNKDFGTTCVVVGIIDNYLVTANCGDSSAICIIPNQYKKTQVPDVRIVGLGLRSSLRSGGTSSSSSQCLTGKKGRDETSMSGYELTEIRLPSLPTPITKEPLPSNHNNPKYHGIYYLSNPHCLNRKSERQRVDQSGVGRVVLGDYAMLRLIPSYLTYSQARDLGLSISMSRSLGHMHLSRCALLPIPDYKILNMGVNPPKKESIDSMRKKREDERLAKIENEKMTYFSEALIEESVLAIGWGKRTIKSRKGTTKTDKVDLDCSTDDERTSGQLDCKESSEPWRDSYIVIMSDGVSDILDAFTIADIISTYQDKSMHEIAGLITSEAERRRRVSSIRTDNCTAIIVRLRNPNVEAPKQCIRKNIIVSPLKPLNIKVGSKG